VGGYNEVVFYPKIMKTRCSFSFLKGFGNHFQMKLTTHGSIPNLGFVNMSEPDFG
jgi:hypothetical protein